MTGRRLLTSLTLALGLAFTGSGNAADSTRLITEREHDWYRLIQVAGLADVDMNKSDMGGLTRYEMAVIVGGAVVRVRAKAWNDSATDAQKVEALQAMQKLVNEFKPDLQRLGVSVKNSMDLLQRELQSIRPEATSGAAGTAKSAAPPTTRTAPQTAPGSRPKLSSVTGLNLFPFSTPGSQRIGMALGSLVPLGSSRPRSGFEFVAVEGSDRGGVLSLFHSGIRVPLGRSLNLSTAVSHSRGMVFDADAMASKATLTYAPGSFVFGAALNTSSRDPIVNAMTGLPAQSLLLPATSVAGDVKVRGPFGLFLGGGVEGIQASEWDTLLGRYSAIVGMEQKASDRLALSLDFARSAFFYDPNTAVYSANVGLGFNYSRSVRFQLLYRAYPDDYRALGQRDGGFQSFMAGQVSVRW